MKIGVLVLAAAWLAVGAGLSAQQPEGPLPPAYRGPVTLVPGIFLTPIAGAPFTATVRIQTDTLLPDGTFETRYTVNQLARDSGGRIHAERHQLVPESFTGTPMLFEVHLFDPKTRMSTFYVPATHVARQQVVPAPPAERNYIRPGTKVEELGYENVEGVQTKHTRNTYTVSVQVNSAAKQVSVIDEYWYSEELHIHLMIRHSDPRTGVQTVQVTHINRQQEPQASLFEVPAGYKVVDLTPPAQPDSPPGAAVTP